MDQEVIELLENLQTFIDSGGNGWINTLTGGMLALVGAFGVQLIQQLSQQKKENKYFLREKLEYIGNLLIEFDSELQTDTAMIFGTASPDDEGKIPAVHSKLQS